MSTARTPCNGRGGQRGAVLVLVLWILTLLTFLLGAFSNEIRVENRIVGDMVERIRLRAGATAVLNYLALAGTASPEGLTSLEGWPLSLPLGKSSVDYRFVPEEAYVSLNAAPPEMLKALIGNYPDGVDDVDALVNALADWRDGDDVVTENGAEAAEYAGANSSPKRPSRGKIGCINQQEGLECTNGIICHTSTLRQLWPPSRRCWSARTRTRPSPWWMPTAS